MNKKLIIIITLFLASCSSSVLYDETDYPSKVIGSWTGTVGDVKETMKLKDDSTFTCRVQPSGFLAQTLSQPLTGTLKGRWSITGKVITLDVEREKHEYILNGSSTSTILKLKSDSLVLQSDSGLVSVFSRVLHI